MPSKVRASIDTQVQFDQYIPFSVTMSAANTFTQVTIPTLVDPNNEFILQIKEIQVIQNALVAVNSNTVGISAQLTRTSKAAISDLTDSDVMSTYRDFLFGGGTFAASLAGGIEYPLNMVFAGKQIIASPNIYFGVTTAGFSAALAFSGRIYYDTIKMSKQDILEVLYG